MTTFGDGKRVHNKAEFCDLEYSPPCANRFEGAGEKKFGRFF